MAKTLRFKCDGCSSEKSVAVGAMPEGWGCVSISITGMRKPHAVTMMDPERTFDLCGACQSHLADYAFPPTWPRDVSKDDANA